MQVNYGLEQSQTITLHQRKIRSQRSISIQDFDCQDAYPTVPLFINFSLQLLGHVLNEGFERLEYPLALHGMYTQPIFAGQHTASSA